MRIAGIFRYRKGQLIMTVPKAQALVIAQAKGLADIKQLHGLACFYNLEV